VGIWGGNGESSFGFLVLSVEFVGKVVCRANQFAGQTGTMIDCRMRENKMINLGTCGLQRKLDLLWLLFIGMRMKNQFFVFVVCNANKFAVFI